MSASTPINSPEWEAQVEALVAKSTEKMKVLIHEKEELQSKIYKMTHLMQQEEKLKDTLRERIKICQEDTNQQLKDKLDFETGIQKRAEELKKLNEEIAKTRDKVQESEKNYNQEINTTTEKNEKNDSDRKLATAKDMEELENNQREKAELTKNYEMLCQELQHLQVFLYKFTKYCRLHYTK